MRIVKDALRLFKPDGMLASIASVLLLAPLKPKHIYMLSIYSLKNKREGRHELSGIMSQLYGSKEAEAMLEGRLLVLARGKRSESCSMRVVNLVDETGIEPATSSLRTK